MALDEGRLQLGDLGGYEPLFEDSMSGRKRVVDTFARNSNHLPEPFRVALAGKAPVSSTKQVNVL